MLLTAVGTRVPPVIEQAVPAGVFNGVADFIVPKSPAIFSLVLDVCEFCFILRAQK